MTCENGKKMWCWTRAHQFQNSMNRARSGNNETKYLYTKCWMFHVTEIISDEQKKNWTLQKWNREKEKEHAHIRVSCQINWYGFCLVPFCMRYPVCIIAVVVWFFFILWYFHSFCLPISCGIFVYYREISFNHLKYFKALSPSLAPATSPLNSQIDFCSLFKFQWNRISSKSAVLAKKIQLFWCCMQKGFKWMVVCIFWQPLFIILL